jgi:hypothetical protein
VHPGGLDAVAHRAAQHRVQVFFVAVHVAVAEQPDEVQRLARGAHAVDEPAPGLAVEHLAGLDRGVDPLGALLEDAAGADRVVADLAVAHVFVARQPDRGAVRGDGHHAKAVEEVVERGRVREVQRVAFVAGPRPTPSRIASTTGPLGPAHDGWRRRIRSVDIGGTLARGAGRGAILLHA